MLNKLTTALMLGAFSLLSISCNASHNSLGEEASQLSSQSRYVQADLNSINFRGKKFVSLHCFGGKGGATQIAEWLEEYKVSIHKIIPYMEDDVGKNPTETNKTKLDSDVGQSQLENAPNVTSAESEAAPKIMKVVPEDMVHMAIGDSAWVLDEKFYFSMLNADSISIGVVTPGYKSDDWLDFYPPSNRQIQELVKELKPYLANGMTILGHGELTVGSTFKGPGTHVWKALTPALLEMIHAEKLTLKNAQPVIFPHLDASKVEKRQWKKEGETSLEEDIGQVLPALLRKIGYAVADKGQEHDKALRKPLLDAVEAFNIRYRFDLPRESWRVVDEALADAVFHIAHKKYVS